MGFMTTPQGGDFDTYVKYNAKAGRWYTKEDKPDAQEYEVTDMTAVFDFENLRTGWFVFAAGQAPEKNFDPSLAEAAPQPNDKAKRGFEIRVYSDANLGGVREFSSTAGAVIEQMNGLYDAWEAGKAANGGKLPVVRCTGVNPITTKHGTNYAPVLEIVDWAERPAGLSADGRPSSSDQGGQGGAPAQQQTAPPNNGPATHAAPPGQSGGKTHF